MKNKNNWLSVYVISEEPEISEAKLLDKYSEGIINIVHFPSIKIQKSTKLIEVVINKVKEKYGNRINYFSERIPNNEVLAVLEKTHIVVDQYNGMYALLAVEGMSRGCVVITGINDWFAEYYPDYPLVNTRKEELEKTLIDLIEDPERMKEIAKQSIKYYHKYHSPKAVGNYYKTTMKLN